jgi:hypothetical protein
MKKQIAKILFKYGIDDYHWKPEIASEIDVLTKEHYATGKDCFAGWYIENIETGVIDMIDMKPCYSLAEDSFKYFTTLDEVYNYWTTEIKNK